jgi:hypothetical protein
MIEEKRLGKIQKATFGIGAYNDVMIGLHIIFSGEGWGIGDNNSTWDSTLVPWTHHCKWSPESRDAEYAKIVHFVSKILADAKVQSVHELVGIPVEITLNGNTLKEWRVLTEVL